MIRKPTLVIKNNTTDTLTVQLFRTSSGQGNNIANANTRYNWNVCSQLFTDLTSVSIQQKAVGAGSFTTYTAPILNSSIDGVIAALNTLNIGRFFQSTVAGFLNISVISDTSVYGSFQIVDNGATGIINGNWNFNLVAPDPSFTFQIVNLTQASINFSSILQSGSYSAPPAARGDNFVCEIFLTNPHTGNIQLFKNGCLFQQQDFNDPTSPFMLFDYDRNDDDYTFVINVLT